MIGGRVAWLVALAPAAVALALALGAGSADAATRYAGPAGSGAAPCTTNGAPFCSVATALAALQCGDTLILKSGTYQGSGQMLDTRANYATNGSCTAGAPMTVRAENDGGPLFDGQDVREPVVLIGVNYWTFQGFNARYSNKSVVTTYSSNNLTLQKIVAWDAGNANDQVLLVWNSDTVLVEDFAGFGSANQICVDYTSTHVTFRRVWCRGEGSTAGRGVTVNQFNYYGNSINPSPPLVENTIQTNAPAAGLRGGSIQWLTDFNRDDGANPGVRYLGGIHYLMSQVEYGIVGNGYKNVGIGACTGYVIQDTVLHAGGFPASPLAFNIGSGAGCSDGGNAHPGIVQQITRLTTVSSRLPSGTGNAVRTNFVEAGTLAATGFNYIGANNTARLCYQYVNGVYQDGTGGTTAKPLWPWPMDDRIKAAIASNAGRGSPALAGTSGPGYAANTVTSEIASLMGAIPKQCNRAASSLVPAPPTGVATK